MMGSRNLLGKALLGLGAGLAVVAVTACSPRVEARGNLPDPQRLANIKPGVDTRDRVADVLGSPSSIAVFDEETWYYISERVETVAFFEPKVTDRKVVVVHFNNKGVVKNVETLGLKDGNNVQPVERITPTAGREFTFMEQLLGNLGRFNKKKEGNTE